MGVDLTRVGQIAIRPPRRSIEKTLLGKSASDLGRQPVESIPSLSALEGPSHPGGRHQHCPSSLVASARRNDEPPKKLAVGESEAAGTGVTAGRGLACTGELARPPPPILLSTPSSYRPGVCADTHYVLCSPEPTTPTRTHNPVPPPCSDFPYPTLPHPSRAVSISPRLQTPAGSFYTQC